MRRVSGNKRWSWQARGKGIGLTEREGINRGYTKDNGSYVPPYRDGVGKRARKTTKINPAELEIL